MCPLSITNLICDTLIPKQLNMLLNILTTRSNPQDKSSFKSPLCSLYVDKTLNLTRSGESTALPFFNGRKDKLKHMFKAAVSSRNL